jgi:hypothetical protein
MPDDYAKATARPGYVRIGETEYRPKKFGPRDVGDLEAYLKREFPDPRLMARELCAGLSDTVALKIWSDLSAEAADWPVTVASNRGNRALMLTFEGNAMLLWIALRRHHADVTLDKARQIAEEVTLEEIGAVLNAAFPAETFLPKDQTSPAPE